MSKSAAESDCKWNERTSACAEVHADTGSMFQLLFERSGDALMLVDPQTSVLLDCNAAAVALMRAETKERLLCVSPAALAPACQPDGRPSAEVAAELIALVSRMGTHRFEWVARRLDGRDVPLEIVATAIPVNGRVLHVLVPRDISERRLVEAQARELNATLEQRIAEHTAALTASEARLRTLVEHAPEAIVVFDGHTGRFLSGNAHACRMYGRSPGELTSLSPAQVSPEFQPDGRRSTEVAREKMDEALAGGTPVFEWIHRDTTGRSIPTEVRLVRLPGGDPPLLRASIIDNSERKRREALQHAALEISEAVHTAGDLSSLYGRVHTIVSTLMPARNFYIALFDGVSDTVSFPYFIDETEPPPDACKLGMGLTSHVLRTGEPLLVGPTMNARKRRVGDEVTFEGYPELRYIERGAPAAIWLGVPLSLGERPFGVMALQDYRDPRAYGEEEKQILMFVAKQTALAIERKRAEQALRESEQKFRALFEATSTGVIIHDESHYLDLNPAVVRMLGYNTAAELIGKNPVLTSPPFQPGGQPTAEAAGQHIERCLQQGSERFEWTARRADGRDLPVEVILTRIEMGGRRVIQAVVNDISERKRAEAEMWRALKQERELRKLKTDFVSMVSHEFRTPLGIILSSAQILSDYLEQLDSDERHEHLDAIAKNSKHMATLMEEVLVLSRVDSGKVAFEPESVELGQLCPRLVEEVTAATANACPIEFVAGEGCGGAYADERLLRHILTNILVNAVKYSPPSSPVRFQVVREEQHAVFRISDRGIGIPAADLERLFSAFHRGRNVGQVAGSGLGLVIVKRCVELHGGTVKLDSKVGSGTTVTVKLPIFVNSAPARDIDSSPALVAAVERHWI